MERRRRRGRGFPDAALAAEQQELHVYIGQKTRFP
jgi:hypothetical protein